MSLSTIKPCFVQGCYLPRGNLQPFETAMPQDVPQIDPNTTASHPGHLRLQFGRYLQRQPKLKTLLVQASVAALISFVSLFVGFALFVRLGRLPLWVVSSIGLIAIFAGASAFDLCSKLWRWRAYYQKKWSRGCLNPGVIVSTTPVRVAVFTDLTLGGGLQFPVVKIVEQPLHKADLPDLAVGRRLPTVALYQSGAPRDRWADFDPEAVVLGTSDQESIQRAAADIGEDSFVALEEALTALGHPTVSGLWPLWEER